MGKQPGVSFSHVGICVSDLERSLRFYTEVLGFTLKQSIPELGTPFDTLVELPGAKLRVHQVQLGGVTLELIGFIDTQVVGPAERRPMNQRGITHLTLVTDDLETVLARVEEFGGTVHPGTRVDSAFGPIVFCSDPDGVRIELMQPVTG